MTGAEAARRHVGIGGGASLAPEKVEEDRPRPEVLRPKMNWWRDDPLGEDFEGPEYKR